MKYSLCLLIFLCASTLIAQRPQTSQSGVYTIDNGYIRAREVPPTWPGCNGTLEELKTCFDQRLSEHISKKFIIPYEVLQKKESNEITVLFEITKRGEVRLRKIIGGIQEIKEIARNTITSIPKLSPGTLGGKKVNSRYEIPISY